MKKVETAKYQIGDTVYAPYTMGRQCLGEIVKVLDDGKYLMYNRRHGHYVVTEEQIDAHN